MKTILSLLFLLCGTAQAQTAVLKYESPRDFKLSFGEMSDGLMAPGHRFDLTGDGVPEVAMIREDAQNRPQTFVLFDFTTREVVWEIAWSEIVALLGEEPIYYPGAFSFYESGDKVVVFRGETTLGIIAVLIGLKQGSATSLALPAEQALMFDVDGDGLVEAIIRNRDTQTVQVWGAGDANTATEAAIETSLNTLSQNYPNPFRETTTISYEVEQTGPVSITVYDVRGHRIHTLVDEAQAIGTYQVVWDGRSDGGQPMASGMYFYRLRIGAAVSSKQALLIK